MHPSLSPGFALARSTAVARALAAALVVGATAAGCGGRGPASDGGRGDAGGTDGATDAAADVAVDVPPPMDVFACTGTTCTVPNGTGACVDGVCQVHSCVPGGYDFDHDARNGCECLVGDVPATCAAARDLGTLGPGSMHLVESLLPAGTTEHWVQVTFAPGGRADVEFVNNPGMAFRFDVVSSCMANAQLACPDRMQGATGMTNWEFFDTAPDAGTTHNNDPMRVVATPGTVYLRITASRPSTSCQPYTLLVRNDVW